MNTLFSKKLCERLRELRIEKELTQNDVAKFLCVDRVTYTRYENGERQIMPEDLSKLADFYDVSVDYIMCRIE